MRGRSKLNRFRGCRSLGKRQDHADKRHRQPTRQLESRLVQPVGCRGYWIAHIRVRVSIERSLSAIFTCERKSRPVLALRLPDTEADPVLGDALSSIATEAITELTKRPAWHSEFRKLSAEIAAQHTRVLVIVDDVDRLDGDELRSLLRLVRLLGRFENVHYDQWLAHELFLALGTELVSTADLVARFGYQLVATSAYAAKRFLRGNESRIKDVYGDVARRWVAEVREEPLSSTLDRPELIQMTSFCAWIANVEDDGGFLSDRICDGEALLDVATKYVFYNKWVGSGVEYDVVFREPEFRFAVGRSLTTTALAEISAPSDDPDYEVADRASPNLTDAQRQDFAIRSLRALSVS